MYSTEYLNIHEVFGIGWNSRQPDLCHDGISAKYKKMFSLNNKLACINAEVCFRPLEQIRPYDFRSMLISMCY